MKIVYCIAGLYNSAGMERVITNKANYLVNHGHDVYIITAEQKGRNCYYELDERIVLYDLDINYAEDKSLLSKLCYAIPKRTKHYKRLSSLLFKIKADIVITTFGNEFFFLYKINDGSKKVAEIHFCKDYRLKRNRLGFWRVIDYIKTKQESRLVNKYDSFVTLTNEDIYNWDCITNIQSIPNPLTHVPVNVSDLTTKNILVVGRLSYQKGIDRLLEIWKDVSPMYPDWSLHIYGSGELESQILNQIHKYNLNHTTFIHRPISNISRAYLNSSCYLMTSRYEGLPMVMLEAMSYGLPVISYACPCGPKDLIINGINGYIIDDGDSNAFKERLIEIIGCEQSRKKLGANARNSVLRFKIDVIMQLWENLFNKLLQ